MLTDQHDPMFDIDDARNVKLERNATDGPTLLRGRRLENLDAKANVAGGASFTATKPWWRRLAGGTWTWILGVAASVVAAAIYAWISP